jgi:hypothetical protein
MQKKLDKLIRFNLIMAGLHFLQGLAIVFISSDKTETINTSYLVFNESTRQLEQASRGLFDLSLAWLVAAFFFLSAAFHLYIATVGAKKYKQGLKNGINKYRWYEYSLSASVMIVAIATLSGIFELSLLIALFALVAVMNLMGLVMEVHNQTTKKTNWVSYWVGCLAGIVPWIVIAIYFWGAATEGGAGTIPTFVYWIYVSIFIFFNLFAINMVLQYKKIGKWSDYLYGERSYIVLSLVAKSLLAWQVFAGALQP